MYIIYKIQCGEDIYIGSTKNYNKRIQEHKYRSKDDKYKHLKLYEKMNNTEPIFSIIQTIEKAKLYRIKNDSKIKAKDKIKITCECGSTFIRRCIIQHQRTKKHNNYINSISYS